MVDFIVEFGGFITNLISEFPDLFKHVFSFLTEFVETGKELFEGGEIVLGILLILILIKIIGSIREAI